MKYEPGEIALQFQFDGTFKSAEPFGTGHINDTYRVAYDKHGSVSYFVLQRINHHVFKKPQQVMDNISRVTEHIRNKLIRQNTADIERKVLKVIVTHAGNTCYHEKQGDYWRAYHYVGNGRTYDKAPSAKFAYEAAKQFGLFGKMLIDMPGPRLHVTIPDFHNGPKRFNKFKKVLESDSFKRAKEVKEEIDFILANEEILNVLPRLVEKGEIPLRPTHNDTKINNVIFDIESNEALCVIDLDTVMPGLTLFDFGDMVRTAASTADEDEPDAAKMGMDIELFGAIARGFAEQTGSFLAGAEKEYFAFSAQVIIFEQVVRFLTDYLEGDVYYKIGRASHNLDRTHTQIALVKSAMAQEEQTNRIVKGLFR